MVATTGYKAALETNGTQISYGIEAAWGTAAGQFQAIRTVSSTLAGARTTQRPSEITSTREAAQEVTTQITAGGTINYAFSSTTFDDIVFANVLQNEWGSTLAITGSSGDITLTISSGMATLTSSTPGKFVGLINKQWIRLLGFSLGATLSDGTVANNGWWFIENRGSSPDNILSLIGPNLASAVTETPTGSAAKVRACTIKNASVCRTFFVEQKLDTALFLQYPGSYAARATLTGGLGAFTTGTVDLVAKTEQKATVTSSTGAVLASPTGRVIDPVGGFVGAFWNGGPLGTCIENFAITMENTGAASEFCMGDTAAHGILSGTFTASGTFRAYFNDFVLFDNVLTETTGELSFILRDSTGYSYAFTFLDARLNGRIVIGGPGQPVSAEYTVSGGPTSAGTFVIDRMAAS